RKNDTVLRASAFRPTAWATPSTGQTGQCSSRPRRRGQGDGTAASAAVHPATAGPDGDGPVAARAAACSSRNAAANDSPALDLAAARCCTPSNTAGDGQSTDTASRAPV